MRVTVDRMALVAVQVTALVPTDGAVTAIPTHPRTIHRALGEHALDPKVFPVLTQIGRNLSQLAADGAFDPVIGRDAEIEQVIDILNKRRSNNPRLVGEPGVGKTASSRE